LSRFVISSLYRAPRDVGYTPKVSVIVACKNEEEHIAAVLERAFDSHYPRELLEVIAIDDGSTDKTLEEMTRVRRKHSDLKLIRFRKNRGKRHGMAAGARAATGDVLVYVDSDSYLERDAIYRIVQGLADPRVAAVAGHAYAANAWTNLLTRTQAVQYYVAFNVLKAAESVFSCVTCCSGCFAAYRRDRVIEVLDVWLNQTFLGRPATFGDDRSLTNFMLRDYKIIYDSRASVSTVVPEKFSQFFRQQLRWKKSWLRENSIAATFLWKKTPIVMLSFFAGFILPLIGPLVVFRALVYLPVVAGHMNYLYVWGVFLMSLLYSAYYLLREKNRMWVCGVFLCFLYALLLTWQLPWAIVTSWNNKWGTR
jgi:hyaluronan synthase